MRQPRFLSALLGTILGSSCAAQVPASARPDLLEQQRVAEVIARFNDSAARRDFATIPQLFRPDAVWEAAAGPLGFKHEGRETIRHWLETNPNRVEVVFYLASQSVIELKAPDEARANTSIIELLRSLDSGEIQQLYGRYTDDLVRRDDRWQFAHRSFQLQHIQKLQPGGGAP